MSPWFRRPRERKEPAESGLLEADRRVLDELRTAGSDLARPHPIDHYLYFPGEAAARSAAKQLQEEGFRVNVRLGADEVNWLVLASNTVMATPDVIEETSSRMEKLAASLGGDYDGWEAQVQR